MTTWPRTVYEPLAIPTVLQTLRLTLASPVLSAYLATGGQWPINESPSRLALRAEAKRLRRELVGENRESFERAVTQAERLLSTIAPGHPGAALFVGGSPAHPLDVAVALPSRPVERVIWDTHPHVAPLERLMDDQERFAVVLFDVRHARLFSIYLSAIEERRDVTDDDVPSRQSTGGWYGLAETHIERHREQHVIWHAQRTNRALTDLLCDKPFDRLLLAGPPEAVAVLKRRLSRPLLSRLIETLDLPVQADEATVLTVAREANERIEELVESSKVRDLLEAPRSAHVALGAAAVLSALAEGRVHELLIAESFAVLGGRCQTCGRLVAAPHVCPSCGTEPVPVPDLGEELVAEAHRQGAVVEYVGRSAAARLRAEAGIGAWTRY